MNGIPDDGIPQGKAVVLFSGGQDSTTCLYWALKGYKEVKAIFIRYGQTHIRERIAAHDIAKKAGVELEEIDIPIGVLKGGSLLGEGDIPETIEKGIASTFVPMRNLLFITIAANRAYLLDYNTIIIGVNSVDYSGYPDCRRYFIDACDSVLSEAADKLMMVITPLIDMDKKQIVELAKTLPGCWEALALSHTCYRGEYPPCGRCPACLLRAKGFEEAGEKDPIFKEVE